MIASFSLDLFAGVSTYASPSMLLDLHITEHSFRSLLAESLEERRMECQLFHQPLANTEHDVKNADIINFPPIPHQFPTNSPPGFLFEALIISLKTPVLGRPKTAGMWQGLRVGGYLVLSVPVAAKHGCPTELVEGKTICVTDLDRAEVPSGTVFAGKFYSLN